MNWVFGIIILIACIFLYVNFLNKRRVKSLEKELREKWGKPKKDNYFNFSLIARYFENSERKDAYQVISLQTAKDLDFEVLFKFLDRTISKVGQQYLYEKLRILWHQKQQFNTSEFSKLFSNDTEFRLLIQQHLARLSSSDAYDLEFWTQKHPVQNKKYQPLLYILSFLSVVFIVLGVFYPFFFVLILPVFIINSVFHYLNKSKLTYHLNGITQLSIAYDVGVKLSKYHEIANRFNIGFFNEISQVKKKISLIGSEKRLNSDIAQLAWLFTELIKILFNFEVLLFYNLEKSLQEKQQAISELFAFIGEVDVAISVASLQAENRKTCIPKFTTSKRINVEKLYHPLLSDCVTNDLELADKSLLLTGTNMSGKTTFIKTLAVNALLAETLGFCYAESYEAPFLRIFSSMKITDDLLADTSYYLQEVINVKHFIDVLEDDRFSLFILDELFKGTNTTERIAAGKAVLSCLNTEKSIVLVATHDVELTELLQDDGYQLHCFDEQISNGKIHFSYKLKEGIPQHRNAIKILELYNYPKCVVSEAQEIANFSLK